MVTNFRNKLEEAGANWEMNTYGGVRHGFTNPDAGSFAWLADVVIAIGLTMLWFRKWLRGNHSQKENQPEKQLSRVRQI